jgi:methionyl-tRNA synthetase
MIDKYGLDYFRYFIMKEIPFGNDGNFAIQQFITRINSELVNNIGNLAQRVLSFIYKNCEGAIPAPAEYSEADKEILAAVYATLPAVQALMAKQQINLYLDKVIDLGRKANEYIDTAAPWTLKRDGNIERMNTVLYVLTEVIRAIAVLLQPIVPQSATNLLLNLGLNNQDFTTLSAKHILVPGHKIPEPKAIFPRLIVD